MSVLMYITGKILSLPVFVKKPLLYSYCYPRVSIKAKAR